VVLLQIERIVLIMNWYNKNIKTAFVPGGMEPISDKYDRGWSPPSSLHREKDFTKVKTHPFVSTNIRGRDHHRNTSNLEPEDAARDIRDIPSEPVLMDQDPPTGEGVNKEQFVDEKDKMPGGDEVSKRLDRGLPPRKKTIYKRLRDGSLVGPVNKL
jgi:hypothetical protein